MELDKEYNIVQGHAPKSFQSDDRGKQQRGGVGGELGERYKGKNGKNAVNSVMCINQTR